MRSRSLGVLGFSVLCATALSINAGGCQADSNSSSSSGPGGPGSGGAGGDTTSSAEGGNGGGTTSGNGGAGGSGGSGPGVPVATIEEITSGMIGEGIDVQVKGAVAMSRKYLVSKGSSGSCLWGVYLSSPGLTETMPNSGILALSYGTQATTQPDGTTACPKLADGTVGDAFPDDVKPGDVLDVTGETSYFLLTPTCANQPPANNPSEVKQRQLGKVSKVERTGAVTPPTPHTLSADEVKNLSSPTDSAFHDTWGGVKVRIAGPIAPVLQGMNQTVVGAYGNIRLADGNTVDLNLQVGDKIYYVKGSADACEQGPNYPDTTVVWDRIDGFSTLDFCTWSLQPAHKCMDFDPAGEDCVGGLMCP